jgi:hypothetical protein
MEEMLHSSKGEILTNNLRYTNLFCSLCFLILSMLDHAELEHILFGLNQGVADQ